jgi:hypothetical protein
MLSWRRQCSQGFPARFTYLHSILYLGHDRIFRDEVEQFPLGGERHGYNEGHKHQHLRYKEYKHLELISKTIALWLEPDGQRTRL